MMVPHICTLRAELVDSRKTCRIMKSIRIDPKKRITRGEKMMPVSPLLILIRSAKERTIRVIAADGGEEAAGKQTRIMISAGTLSLRLIKRTTIMKVDGIFLAAAVALSRVTKNRPI